MKTVRRTVHYCDWCKKRMFQIPAMARHEESCLLNPKRVCGLCGYSPDLTELIAYLKEVQEVLVLPPGDLFDISIEEKAEAYKTAWQKLSAAPETGAGDCPACFLSAIRRADVHCEQFDYQELAHKWRTEEHQEYLSGICTDLGGW